ncbi:class 1 fructose-bisphosphatase [Azospirillum sp.]|uniref:class 1 fructose-bisphosphatase n=1 Tax=Azospirillum sp. TaxID=34012 RepID=UPI002D266CC0|nr:class 1 fructose-bisphosphatase [Azospirillum sp.]HYD66290.1 class 1 fructose-bisphosphatase [Azospirillum sp.]
MPFRDNTTLAQYLLAESRKNPDIGTDLVALILDASRACKLISKLVAQGALANVLGKAEGVNVQGEEQAKLDVMSDDTFRRSTEFGGHVCAVASEEQDEPVPVPPEYPRGEFLLLYDPLDGSSNIDVNVAVGSIFSVLRMPRPGKEAVAEDFLQPGTRQVAAGYAIYGPSTMLVLTVGNGVAGFTLHPLIGDFVLTHPNITVPAQTQEFAVNASNSRFWEPPVKRYVEECMAGTEGPRGKDFNMRWIASMVAEAHRILMRGGVFMYPRDTKKPLRPGRLRLMYEANPIALIMEQAGAAASTGTERILEVTPSDLHQRIPLIFGSREEVERIEAYHRDSAIPKADTPLFNARGLFRAAL